MDWNGKPYHSLDYELKKQFGHKVYKLYSGISYRCCSGNFMLFNNGRKCIKSIVTKFYCTYNNTCNIYIYLRDII